MCALANDARSKKRVEGKSFAARCVLRRKVQKKQKVVNLFLTNAALAIRKLQTAPLPKSEGTKRKLVERYPALKLVIKKWFLCLEAAWDEMVLVTCSEANYAFDQILKRRKSEFEQAGVHNALPDKVSKWWFHKMKAEMGLKYTVVGRELCHGMLKE